MVLPLAELTVKTQQTPKPAAHEPLLEPPLEEHSLKWNVFKLRKWESTYSLLYFRPSTYLEVKQVPFLYDVDPLLSWLVLTHGSFLKLTIVNREKTWTKNYLFNFHYRNDNKVCKTVYIILTFAFPISFVRNFCRFVLSCQTLETT